MPNQVPAVVDSLSVSSTEKAVVFENADMAVSSSTQEEHVLPETAPLGAHEEDLAWSKVRTIWQDAFSEFLGVMILIIFGDGVVAQVVLSKGAKGDYQSISWGWG